MTAPFGPLPDHGDPEFLGCLLTCVASSNPDPETLWTCYVGCVLAYHARQSDDESETNDDTDDSDEDDSTPTS